VGGLEVLDPRYQVLYERILAVLAEDDRVKAVELTGSVATRTADRWSDLDLQVITHADHHDEFLADWPRWLGTITPTVFARTPLAPFIINTVTDEGLTLDLAVYADWAPPPFLPSTTEYAVGMMSGRRFTDLAEALDYAVAEQLRGLAGPFVSLLQRGEHVRHLTGVPHLLGLLTTVFLAESGAPPPAKHWNRTFTPEQRAAVAALPAVRATREDITAFGLGLAELLLTRARPLFDVHGLRWPAELATVAAERLRTVLDIDATSWLR
jgi:hypothetical protein